MCVCNTGPTGIPVCPGTAGVPLVFTLSNTQASLFSGDDQSVQEYNGRFLIHINTQSLLLLLVHSVCFCMLLLPVLAMLVRFFFLERLKFGLEKGKITQIVQKHWQRANRPPPPNPPPSPAAAAVDLLLWCSSSRFIV